MCRILAICAALSVCSLGFGQDSNTIVDFRLETTDLEGNPTSTVNVGEQFQLTAFVRDVRDDPKGVFAFYSDIVYPADLITTTGAVEFSDLFANGPNVDASTAGLLNELGSFTTVFSETDGEEYHAWSLLFTANAPGQANFESNPAEHSPPHDVLVLELDQPFVDPANISFGSATLTIVPEPGAFEAGLVLSCVALCFLRRLRGRKRHNTP